MIEMIHYGLFKEKRKMVRKKSAVIMCALLALSLLAGCGKTPTASFGISEQKESEQIKNSAENKESEEVKQEASEGSKEVKKEESAEEAVEKLTVENNGAYFVKIGKYVYFRNYGPTSLEDAVTFGDFSKRPTGFDKTDMMKYDPETGETTVAFSDDAGCYEIFSFDGRIYSQKMASEDYSAYATVVYSVKPDGSDYVEYGSGKALGKDAATDTLIVESHDENYSAVITLYKGTQLAATISGKDEQSVQFFGADKGKIAYGCCEYDTENFITYNYLYVYDIASGVTKNMGMFAQNDMGAWIENPQVLFTDKSVVLAAKFYAGTGNFYQNGVVVSASLEEENSVQEVTFQDDEEDMYDVWCLSNVTESDTDGLKVERLKGLPNTVNVYEDQVFITDEEGVQTVFTGDFLCHLPNGTPLEDMAENACLIDGKIYVTKNCCLYDEINNVGWRFTFDRLATEYICVDPVTKESVLMARTDVGQGPVSAVVWSTKPENIVAGDEGKKAYIEYSNENMIIYRPIMAEDSFNDFSYTCFGIEPSADFKVDFSQIAVLELTDKSEGNIEDYNEFINSIGEFISSIRESAGRYGELELPEEDGVDCIADIYFNPLGQVEKIVFKTVTGFDPPVEE